MIRDYIAVDVETTGLNPARDDCWRSELHGSSMEK